MFCSPQILARPTPRPSAGGGLTPTTFDGASLSNATLSNGNLTATRSNTSTGGAQSIAYKSAGRFYFEVTIGASNANTDFIGIMASSAGYFAITNGTTGSYSGYWVKNGTLLTNGGSVGSLGAGAASDVISGACDIDNLRLWLRRNGGNWNGSGTANPATNTGGIVTFANVAPVLGSVVSAVL
ncbi:hypothetical protein QIH80_37335 [Bradyrhizobium elkanii]|nr:hypothetical protein QIH80_37335 [Bradyrhizobium elkanii]